MPTSYTTSWDLTTGTLAGSGESPRPVTRYTWRMHAFSEATLPDKSDSPVLDLRTYKLVPGRRDEFDRIFCEGALPMLRRYGIQVVGYGPSLDDDDHYYLARAFPSASDRQEQLGSFYGSEEWRQTYEAAVIALIEAHHTVVIPLGTRIAEALGRRSVAAEDTRPGGRPPGR